MVGLESRCWCVCVFIYESLQTKLKGYDEDYDIDGEYLITLKKKKPT